MDSLVNHAGSSGAYRTRTPVISGRSLGKEEPSAVSHTQPPTVFIIDADVSMRASLEALVRIEGREVRTFESAKEFLSLKRVRAPGCLVLEVSLPDCTGLEVQERLNREHAKLPIIFVTGRNDVSTTVRAMKAGAIEFLTKPVDEGALLAAIDAGLRHSEICLEKTAELEALRANFDALTKREREVMHLLVRGLLNKQVACELGISQVTVKIYRRAVMHKMKARSFAELVQMASRLGADGEPRPDPTRNVRGIDRADASRGSREAERCAGR